MGEGEEGGHQAPEDRVLEALETEGGNRGGDLPSRGVDTHFLVQGEGPFQGGQGLEEGVLKEGEVIDSLWCSFFQYNGSLAVL